MAKYPTPGLVKTRLAAAIGPEGASALHRAFIVDLAARLRKLPWPVTWAFWPPESAFADLVAGQRAIPQHGRDLGERLETALGGLLTTGARRPVLALGADAPHVPLTALRGAVRALSGSADVVLGPAYDGGYYLLGLREPAPPLFRDIPWGTSAVLETTEARACAAGLIVHRVDATFDVDGPADLEMLRQVAFRVPWLPHTKAVLATIHPMSGPENPP